MGEARYPWLLESDTGDGAAKVLLESDTDGTAAALLELVDPGAPIGNRPFTMKTSTQKLEPQRRRPRLSAVVKLIRRH